MKKNKLISVILYTFVGLLAGSLIAIDYFVLKPVLGIQTGKTHWIGTLFTMAIILILMTATRFARKQSKIDKNEKIDKYQKKLEMHYNTILNNGMFDTLEEYLKTYNEDVKYNTFIEHLNKKITKCKKPEKKAKLIELRNTPKEEVLQMNFKYSKVTSTALYSNVVGKVNDDPNKISVSDFLDTAKMLGTKGVMMLAGAMFTGQIAYDFATVGVNALIGTIFKIIIISSAMFTAIISADKFVKYDVETTMKKRIRISLAFINSSEENKKIFGVQKIDDEIEEKESE